MKAYQRYMTQIAILLGANVENATRELEHVVMFEKKLANVSRKHQKLAQFNFTNVTCQFIIRRHPFLRSTDTIHQPFIGK